MDLSLRQLSFWRYLFRQGIHGQNPIQGRTNIRNLGSARTRTEKILEIPDQLGPAPEKQKMGSGPNIFGSNRTVRLGPARTDTTFRNLGSTRTRTKERAGPRGTGRSKTTKILKTSDQFGLIGPWIPDSEYASNHLSGSASLSMTQRPRS